MNETCPGRFCFSTVELRNVSWEFDLIDPSKVIQPVYCYPCMAHVLLAMHRWSTITEFYYLMCFFNLVLKLCLYFVGEHSVFVFDSVLLPFWCLFAVISWKITFVQSSNRSDQKKIWGFKMLTLNSFKFNQNKLQTLPRRLKQNRVKMLEITSS